MTLQNPTAPERMEMIPSMPERVEMFTSMRNRESQCMPGVGRAQLILSIQSICLARNENYSHCCECAVCRENFWVNSKRSIAFARVSKYDDQGPLYYQGLLRFHWVPYLILAEAQSVRVAYTWLTNFDGARTCPVLLQQTQDREAFRKSGLGLRFGVDPKLMVLPRPMLNVVAKSNGVAAAASLSDVSVQQKITEVTGAVDLDEILHAVTHARLQRYLRKHIPGVSVNRKGAVLRGAVKLILGKKAQKLSASIRLPSGIVEEIESYL